MLFGLLGRTARGFKPAGLTVMPPTGRQGRAATRAAALPTVYRQTTRRTPVQDIQRLHRPHPRDILCGRSRCDRLPGAPPGHQTAY